ncbi:MAG: hypothetical protein ACD_23C00143G0001, partial [uncultured bacterium]
MEAWPNDSGLYNPVLLCGSTMPNLPACPQCTLENTYPDGGNYVCPDCGFEWLQTAVPEAGEDASGPV